MATRGDLRSRSPPSPRFWASERSRSPTPSERRRRRPPQHRNTATPPSTLVAEVRRHAWAAHRMALTFDEALLLAVRAELNADPPTAIPDSTTAPERREKP